MATSPDDILTIVERAEEGDPEALGRAFDHYRGSLRRMVGVRLDPRLRRRVDPSDVVQEAYLEVARQGSPRAAGGRLPFFLWLRLVVGQRVLAVERRHLGAQARDARREAPAAAGPHAQTEAFATLVASSMTSVAGHAVRAEMQIIIQQALERMSPLDREVLVMRHYEDLSNVEVAQELGLTRVAARQRYVRAARRLREVLEGLTR